MLMDFFPPYSRPGTLLEVEGTPLEHPVRGGTPPLYSPKSMYQS